MSSRTLLGGFWLLVALWGLAAFTGSAESPSPAESYPAIVPADCGPQPAYDKAHTDEWYTYGDCSGDYGIIDAAE